MGFPGGASGKEPAFQYRLCKKMQAQSLGWEDPLGEDVATHSVFLPRESHGQRNLESCRSVGEHTVGHD